ncbi:MAG TPA: hypothetical protein VJ726_00545 [Candidatus Limnocylindria bacterium]|nr:hypothetical protein [Candidatus Limnocylindria bacterium]
MATRASAPESSLRHWSAWLPVAISVFLIALALRHVAIYGPGMGADEGAEAHLFQLLMPVQALVIAYFAYTWLPKSPRLALALLAAQLAAASGVIALVFWLEHA